VIIDRSGRAQIVNDQKGEEREPLLMTGKIKNKQKGKKSKKGPSPNKIQLSRREKNSKLKGRKRYHVQHTREAN